MCEFVALERLNKAVDLSLCNAENSNFSFQSSLRIPSYLHLQSNLVNVTSQRGSAQFAARRGGGHVSVRVRQDTACACRISTLTCSLARAIGLRHDETNTKLSIEQPMDLKPQKARYSTGPRSVSQRATSAGYYLAVSCLRALRKVSGWKSSDRSKVSDRRACLPARSTQLWRQRMKHTDSHINQLKEPAIKHLT